MFRVMFLPEYFLIFGEHMKMVLFFSDCKPGDIVHSLLYRWQYLLSPGWSILTDCIYNWMWRQGTNPRVQKWLSLRLKPWGKLCFSMCTVFNIWCRHWLSTFIPAFHAATELSFEHPVVHTKVAKELLWRLLNFSTSRTSLCKAVGPQNNILFEMQICNV